MLTNGANSNGVQSSTITVTAGNSYSFAVTNTNNVDFQTITATETGKIVGSYNRLIQTVDILNGTSFVAAKTGTFSLLLFTSGLNSDYSIEMIESATTTPTETTAAATTPTEPTATTPTTDSIDTLINDALVYVKTYVDTKDAALKVYADDLISQLMNSTDLSAKLALINEINQILDGDAATAGFQLWESNVAKLNKVVADLVAETSARSSEIGATSNSLQTMINTTATEINARIDSINSGLSDSISTNVATLNTNVTANFVAMKSKAAVIFAV